MQIVQKDRIGLDEFEVLSNAIVMMAAGDYINLLAGLEPRNVPHKGGVTPTIGECESFFRSPWFEGLTGVDGEWFMDECKKKAKELIIVYTVAQDEESQRWYVCKLGEEQTPLSSFYKSKYKALEKAAGMQGLDMFTYNKIRKRDGFK